MNEKNIVSNELETETETEVLDTENVEASDTENVTEENENTEVTEDNQEDQGESEALELGLPSYQTEQIVEVPVPYTIQDSQYARYSFFLLAFLVIFLILTRLER